MKSSFIKTISILLFLSSTTLFAGNPPSKGYTIKIKINGLKEGSKCILAYYNWDKQYVKDSAVSDPKGEVTFTGKEKADQGIYLFVPPSKKYFDFVMDSTQNFSIETDTIDYVKNMKVKGSLENKYFFDYQNYMAAKQKETEPLRAEATRLADKKDSLKLVQDKAAAIDKETKDYKLDFIKAHPTSFVSKIFRAMQEPEIPEAPILANGRKDSTFAYRYYKSHFFDAMDFSDERLLRTPIFYNKIKQYMDKLTPHLADSLNISADYLVAKSRANAEVFKYIVYWITSSYETSQIMGDDAVFVHMVQKYYETHQTPWMDSTQYYKIINRAAFLNPILLGRVPPNIIMPDSTGKNISLYDVKAKYTVVLFWDHGCGHCKKEVPKLVDAYNKKLKVRGVEVFAVETEDKPEEWRKFIRENKMNWINVHQPDEYPRAVTKKYYDIYSTPVIYLLDENKVIKAKRIDTEQLDGFIDHLESEKVKK